MRLLPTLLAALLSFVLPSLAATTLQFAPLVATPLPQGVQLNPTATLEAQGNQTLLTLNFAGNDGTVTGVYFESPYAVALGLPGADVRFVTGGSPAELPAGNTIDFATNYLFSADNPSTKWGIDPAESLTFLIDANLEDVEASSLRLGLKVQSLGAESVSAALVSVPEPCTALLGSLGLLAILRRRR